MHPFTPKIAILRTKSQDLSKYTDFLPRWGKNANVVLNIGGWNYAKSQILKLILRKIGSRSAKRLKGRPIGVTLRTYMSAEILKIHEVAPELLGFSKVALADFEFDTPELYGHIVLWNRITVSCTYRE